MSEHLAKVATQFLERPGLAQTTVRSYESALIPLLARYGSWPIRLLDRPVLTEYFNDLDQISYTTHHRHQAIIQALFNFAVDHGYLSANPIGRLKRRKPNTNKGEHLSDQPIRYFNQEQLTRIYESIRLDNRMNALIHLLHQTGARISEILALDLDDVNLEQRSFQVVGKGNKTRWCFYSAEAARAIAKYLKYTRHPEQIALFTAQHPKTKQITRLSYRTAYQHWKNLLADHEELTGARLHDFRHTFATERVGLIALEELRALMGHENIQTTLRYQKVTSEKAKEAARRAFNKLTSDKA